MLRSRKKIKSIVIIIILSIFVIISMYPLFFVFVSSFKNNREFYSNFWALPSKLRWSNYSEVFDDVMNWVKNSGIYSTLNVLLDLTVASMGGWAFARYKFKFKEFIFYSIIIFMMLPGILLVVPMYIEIVKLLNGTNNAWALILPWTASDAPLGIFILRRFFQTQPSELFEAAKVDGASEFRIFTQIAIPLAKPALATVAILDIIFTINDFIWPMLVMTKRNLQPLAVGMLAYSPGSGGAIGWGNVFAAYVLASIPMLIFFAIFAKQFVEALTEGTIK